ncbi:cytochrome P450 [Ktedonosporobacter rubrisoli]|uniref:Cytochrome P450 n=1 Tax=Ktedonosporobacter rubrisoli TaxID=2509675 RepID=A0A4P6JIW1_KTERU|nr:cytochrome P450 [Ktedonosporobacter rubrisoli]QBD75024.1 cytochrome P450 [Ktedonosporobacter rubrisoli]
MSMDKATSLSMKNALQPPYLSNPYPLYRQLRESDPVHWDQEANAWVLTRYADVMEALRDPRLSAGRMSAENYNLPEPLREKGEEITSIIARQILFLNPPDHTRLRGLVSKAFTPRRIEAMRAQIQEIVDQLLDEVQGKGRMEVLSDFAFPLPSIVIAQMLGVPPEDREQFAQGTVAFGELIDGAIKTPQDMQQIFFKVADFLDYFRQLIALRRGHPQDDLIQALLVAEEQGETLSEEEIISNCLLLLAAGHGTTIDAIGNGLAALHQYPDQLQDLQKHPALITAAVQELLRYDGPVQRTARIAQEDLEIGGKRIQAGDEVITCLGAANHDPEQFPNPDCLDLRRNEHKMLSFGQGIHFCLGSPLARLELEIAFNTLLARFPEMRIETPELKWEGSLTFRGLQELPVSFTRS